MRRKRQDLEKTGLQNQLYFKVNSVKLSSLKVAQVILFHTELTAFRRN